MRLLSFVSTILLAIGVIVVLSAAFLMVTGKWEPVVNEHWEQVEYVLEEKEPADYLLQPGERVYPYVLRGEEGVISLTVYEGLSDYLGGKSRTYTCFNNVCPTETELELRKINEINQKPPILELVEKIKEKTPDMDDQARITISLVQHIPYDTVAFETGNLTGKYPYEVLYTHTGVCGEKSPLLVLLLRELGFGVALFNFPEQNHQAVGIKCPTEYSYGGSGYCFIETTSPTIPTNHTEKYINVGNLPPAPPKVLVISEGMEMVSIGKEYADAQEWILLNQKSEELNHILPNEDFQRRIELAGEYGIELVMTEGELTECNELTTLCNGTCWTNCGEYQVFECTAEGGVCKNDPNNCPPGTQTCNEACWNACEEGVFLCTPNGGVCRI